MSIRTIDVGLVAQIPWDVTIEEALENTWLLLRRLRLLDNRPDFLSFNFSQREYFVYPDRAEWRGYGSPNEVWHRLGEPPHVRWELEK
jgi:hypothetical protein